MNDAPTASNANVFALYVHWPWCLAKCPYCDFNSRAGAIETVDQEAYAAAIAAELDYYASKTNQGVLGSIYFGGGTPSLMAPDTVAEVIERAKRTWTPARNLEITIEANPTSVEAAKFRALRDAGANRVSVGVQALNDQDLQALGREHTADEARHAVEIAAAVFDRYTFDLIYARPDQGVGAWEDELTQALELASDHISLYQLTIEPGTEFFRRRVAEAPEDLAVELYQLTQDLSAEAGLTAYEISNHAKPGAESRHNLVYWRGHDYIGVGPGAHGRVTADGARLATHQISDPARWLDAVTRLGHGTAKSRRLSVEDRAEELLLAGLRLTEGIDRARFRQITGLDVVDIVDARGLDLLTNEGFVTLTDRTLCVSPEGRLTLNAILERLLA